MGHLDQHLHRLFLDHDCVVVPGLGGFVCNRQPARYDGTRQEITPPTRSILFNERLTHHDGVLAQAVAQKEGCTYDEALLLLNDEARQLKNGIASGRTLGIEHVGRLYRGAEGRIQFMADEEMERLLRSFGLQRVPLRPLQSQPLQPAPKKETPVIQLHTADASTPWKRLAAAIAVPIVGGVGMFFMDRWNADDARMSAWPLTTTTPSEVLYQPRMAEESVPSWDSREEVADVPVAIDADMALNTEEGSNALEGNVETANPVVEAPSGIQSKSLYMLVAGAFAVEQNARNLAESLVEDGHASEVFWDEVKELHIVAFSVHLEEESARTHLDELRSHEQSKNAWLKRWKATASKS